MMNKKRITIFLSILVFLIAGALMLHKKSNELIQGGISDTLAYVEGEVLTVDLQTKSITVLLLDEKQDYYEDTEVTLDCSKAVDKDILKSLNKGTKIKFAFFRAKPFRPYIINA